MKKRTNKTFFRKMSILELMVSICIMSVFSSGVFSISNSFLVDFTFKSSFSNLSSKVSLINILGLFQDEPIKIRIFRNDNRYFFHVYNCDSKLGSYKSFFNKVHELKGINEIGFMKDNNYFLIDREFVISAPIFSYDQSGEILILKGVSNNKQIVFSEYV